jgi:hypothetical protein
MHGMRSQAAALGVSMFVMDMLSLQQIAVGCLMVVQAARLNSTQLQGKRLVTDGRLQGMIYIAWQPSTGLEAELVEVSCLANGHWWVS